MLYTISSSDSLHQEKQTLPKDLCVINFTSVYVCRTCVSECHLCADAQKREAEESMSCSELQLQVVVNQLMWVVETEFRSSGTTGSALNC